MKFKGHEIRETEKGVTKRLQNKEKNFHTPD